MYHQAASARLELSQADCLCHQAAARLELSQATCMCHQAASARLELSQAAAGLGVRYVQYPPLQPGYAQCVGRVARHGGVMAFF